MTFLFLLLVILGVAFYFMTPEERTRAIRAVPPATRQFMDAAQGGPKDEAFSGALRERTPWALVTPALIVINTLIVVFMLFNATGLGDYEMLLGWGGNFGPRTTNGEWKRLVTATFVHTGMLHLLANLAGLIAVGFITERLIGSFAFAAVYILAGIFASIVSLYAHPLGLSLGASGAIFGIYGVLLATLAWSALKHSPVRIPLAVLKALGPAAAVFLAYNMATDGLEGAAELAGFVTGVAFGIAVATDLVHHMPEARRVAITMAVTVGIALVSVAPLRGVDDIRPEIEKVVAVEDRTASVYEAAVDRFRKGRVSAEALAQLIDRTIVPELQAAEARLKTFDNVPREHQSLIAAAEEYLQMRHESWRLRAEGLRTISQGLLRQTEGAKPASVESRRVRAEALEKSVTLTLKKAESVERASLDALQKIKPANQP